MKISAEWRSDIENAYCSSRTVCIALFSLNGELISANETMSELLGAEPLKSIVYPSFQELVKKSSQDPLIFEGTVEIDAKSSGIKTIQGKIFKKNGQMLMIGEKDADLPEIMRNRILSIISHDLRGPVGVYKLLLEALVNDFDLNDKQELQNILKMLSQGLSSSFDLLDNLVTWAKNRQNKISFQPEKLPLELVIEETIKSLDEIAKNKQIVILKNLPENARIYGDSNLVSIIFKNLIHNAIKFSHPGKTIRIEALENEKEWIVSIQDEGVGMNPEQLKKLFTYNGHFSTFGTQDEKGSGLGLLLCKDLIRRHNGDLWVESKLEKGSTFSFSLPKEDKAK